MMTLEMTMMRSERSEARPACAMVSRALALVVLAMLATAPAFAQCPTIAKMAAEPQSPRDNETVTSSPVTLSWNSATPTASVAGYEVWVTKPGDTAASKVATTVAGVLSVQYSWSGAGTYQWFVRTNYTNCNVPLDSTVLKFSAVTCIGPVTLGNPGNGATNVSRTPVMTFSATGADSFDIYLVRGTSAGCPITTVSPMATVQANANGGGTFTPPQLDSGTGYTWMVTAKKSNCPNVNSTCSVFATTSSTPFTVDFTAANLVAGQPTSFTGSVSPANTAIASWSWAFGDNNTAAGQNQTHTYANPGTYSVTLVGTDGNGNSAFQRKDIIIAGGAGCPTAGPSLIKPSPGSTGVANPVAFSWGAVANATDYTVFLFANADTNSSPQTFTVTSTSLTQTLAASTRYAWGVEAHVPNCGSIRSSFAVFDTASGTVCPTQAPTLNTPAAGDSFTANQDITFSWNGVSGAIGYDVRAATVAASTNFTTVGSTDAQTTSLRKTLPVGDFLWKVTAKFASPCNTVDSPENRFSVKSACATTGAAITSPADNSAFSVGDTVHTAWTAVTNAAGYKGYYSLDGGTTVKDFFTITPGSQTALDFKTLAAGSYIWWVTAFFDGSANCPTVESARLRFTIGTKCPDNPQSASLLTPANGATGVTSPATLTWVAVPGAVAYKVWASVNSAAVSLISVQTGTSYTGAVPQGTVVWYVETLFGDNCPTTISQRFTFTVATATDCSKNSAPTLSKPANGASGVTSPVTFEWSSISNAIAYKLLVAVNGGSFETFAATTDKTSVDRIVEAGTVEWYVQAFFTSCPTLDSPHGRFTVKSADTCPTGTIALLEPASGSTQTSPVTFKWSGFTGVSFYRVWVSIDGAAPAVLINTTQTSVTSAIPSGSYEWYVEALFSTSTTANTCPSVSSSHGRFTVPKAATCDTHTGPLLTFPAAGATNVTSPVDFAWSAAAGAVSYRVWISVDGSAFADLGTTADLHLKKDVSEGTIDWFVEAQFGNCPSVRSEVRRFTIARINRCTSAGPSLISPADGAMNVTSPVLLIWSAVPNAIGYRIFASLDSGEFFLVGSTTETTAEKQAPPGTIKWFVEAVFDGCSSTRSEKRTFTVARATNCGTEAPVLLTPANGAANITSPVTFAWSPVSKAAGYQLWIKPASGSPTAIGKAGDDIQATVPLPAGTYEWWVEAFFTGCPSTEAGHSTFTIPVQDRCEPRSALLLSPPDGSTNLVSPVQFSWTAIAKAIGYKVWASVDGGGFSVLGTSLDNELTAMVPSGVIAWYAETLFGNCSSVSSTSLFTSIKTAPPCKTPERPVANVIGQVQTGGTYAVRWTPVANASSYELQEASSPDFALATTTVVPGLFLEITHTVVAPSPFFYRVRAVSNCSDDRGPYSAVVIVVVVPPPAQTQKSFSASTEAGAQAPVVQKVFLPGFGGFPVHFSVIADKPWITVVPSSGDLPPEGTTLTITSDPATLPLGTNSGTLFITYTAIAKGKLGTNATMPPPTVPVSISLVTPVSPTSKNTPGPDSLIVPAVGHAEGANNAKFESDVRLTNTGASVQKYLLNFTPSGALGASAVKQTTVQVDPGTTMALDDILSSFFGVGTSAGNTSALGVLEIRPSTSSVTSSLGDSKVSTTTVASSKTYNVTADGTTFGQYIPAIPFAQFIAKSTDLLKPSVLSIQQISQSADNSTGYRTNFGILEAAGEPADVEVTVFDKTNSVLKVIPLSLAAGEHRQINTFLSGYGIFTDEARLEIKVTSATGKVSAYASVVDNRTNDPLLVSPVLKSGVSSNRYVIPGIADLNNGVLTWRSDVRLYNAGAIPATATLMYTQQRGETQLPVTKSVTLMPGQIYPLDSVVQSFFGLSATGGQILVTTPTTSSIISTARTYTDDQATKGTYGQFIPAITPSESVGLKDRALQVLQAEQSPRFRTNIGLSETTGTTATVEVSVILPESKVTPKITVTLNPNEFYQMTGLFASLGIPTAYNARIAVKVTGGGGKVTAYGSIIDNATGDPTYVPAQ
jgi:PKD domain